jgi:epoxyqueuosine reductase
MSEARRLGEVVRRAGERLGLARVAAVPVAPPRRLDLYRRWLADGHHGEMTYLASPAHLAARADLRTLLAGARTVIACALAHDSGAPRDPAAPAIARYARGTDYHLVLRDKLVALADALADAAGRPVASRPCVDSAPVLEREWAERAGLGFVGKHTLVIVPGLGSWVLLGELLVDVEVDLGDDAPRPLPSRCGSCRACLDACPTGALVDEHLLDARRCISYLTIESQRAIPAELRRGMGGWVFGCDVCQEACPYNQAPPRAPVPDALRPRDAAHAVPDLLGLATAPTNQLRRFVRQSALRRVSRAQLLRNVCVALGNLGDGAALPALARRLGDVAPLVRRHAGWALGEIGARHPAVRAEAAALLAAAAAAEPDPEVADELAAARARLAQGEPAASPRT